MDIISLYPILDICIHLVFSYLFRKVACEELSLECNSSLGNLASDQDFSHKTLLSENQGQKNATPKERENIVHRHHSLNGGRGCNKKG